MAGGQFLSLVFQNKRQVNGVAGAPNAALAIHVTFQPFLYLFSAHIEIAERKRQLFLHFQVTDIFSIGGSNHKRAAVFVLDFGKTLPIGFSFSYRLHLVVVNRYIGSGKRRCGKDIGNGNGQLIFVSAFDDNSHVGCHNRGFDDAVAVHKIGGFARVVALFPVVFRPIDGFVIIGRCFVPNRFIFFANGFVIKITHGCVLRNTGHRSAAIVQRIIGLHRKLHHINRSRVFVYHRSQINGKIVPTSQIQCFIGIQTDLFFLDQSSESSHFAIRTAVHRIRL